MRFFHLSVITVKSGSWLRDRSSWTLQSENWQLHSFHNSVSYAVKQLTVRIDESLYTRLANLAAIDEELSTLSSNQLIVEILKTFVFTSYLMGHLETKDDSDKRYQRRPKLRHYYGHPSESIDVTNFTK